jgi:translation elongation factor EF-1beta
VWLTKRVAKINSSLFVLDGVRSTEDWDIVNAAFGLSNLKATIVITDNRSVAMHCVNNNPQKVVNVYCLHKDQARRLFDQQVRTTV